MKRENQRVVISKRMIKAGLLNLLREKELGKVNVSELCRAAGVNRATFYRHYDSPRAVVLDMALDMARELRQTLKLPRTAAEGEAFLEELCGYFYSRRDVLRLLIRCNTDEDLARMVREFGESLRAMQKEVDQLRGMDEYDMRLTATCLGYGGYYLLRQWIMEDIPKTPAQIAHLIMLMLTKEVCV